MKREGQGIVIPHEHGGWAMITAPFVLGMLVGEPRLMHIPLFLAWLFLYLSSYPLLQALKRKTNRPRLIRWGAIYGAVGAACLLPPLADRPALIYFAPILIALFLVNIWHVLRKDERAILNDLSAVLLFSMGGAGACVLGGGGWDAGLLYIVLYCFLHFAGSSFFVKTMFRERGNRRWVHYARIGHAVILLIPLLVGNAWMMIPYIYSAVRTLLFAGKAMRPMAVGLIEIFGVVQFVILSLIWI